MRRINELMKRGLAVLLSVSMGLAPGVPALTGAGFSYAAEKTAEKTAEKEPGSGLKKATASDAKKATASDAKKDDKKEDKKAPDIKDLLDEDGFLKDGDVFDDLEADAEKEEIELKDEELKKEAELPEEIESEAFEAEQEIDGVVIAVSAPEGVFPAGAELSVRKVDQGTELRRIEDAVSEEREADTTVSEAFRYDIKVLVDGEEVQPDTEAGLVQVSFGIDAPAENLRDVNVYHVSGEETDAALKADALEAEVLTENGEAVELREEPELSAVIDEEEESSEEPVQALDDSELTISGIAAPEDGEEAGDAEEAGDEDDEDVLTGEDHEAEAIRFNQEMEAKLRNGKTTSDPVRREKLIINVETEGFSYYVVEFTYNSLQYVMEGDSEISLSEILARLGISGAVTDVKVSDSSLVGVEKQGSGWKVVSREAFNTLEWMDVTVDGAVYRIVLTDASTTVASNVKWSSTKGVASFKITTAGYYTMDLYRTSGGSTTKISWWTSSRYLSKGSYTQDWRGSFTESGSYYFTIKYLGSSRTGTSNTYKYTLPSRQLSKPSNFRISGKTVYWNSVSGASRYQIRVYNTSGTQYTSYETTGTSYTISSSLYTGQRIAVVAVPSSITSYRVSQESYFYYNSSTGVAVTSVTISPWQYTLKVGQTQQLSYTVYPSNASNKSVYWTTDNSSIATVSSYGVVTAVAPGSTRIYVHTYDGNKTDWASITVQGDINVTSVSVTPYYNTVQIGQTKQLYASVSPTNATNKSVYWVSNDPSIASVNYNTGLVTAKKAGTTYVYAHSVDGDKTDYALINVPTVSVSYIDIESDNVTMDVGEMRTLAVSVYPSNASNKTVYWSSADSNIAAASTTGLITAKKEGTVRITARSADGNHTDYVNVTVKKKGKKNGFYKENGNTYYYTNGVKAKGWKTIDNKYYYFDPSNGIMTTGEKTINKIPCYFDPETGAGLHNGWRTIGGKKYWYEQGQRQGTRYDKKGVVGDGTIRGREIYDPDSSAWYWLDSVYDGAKAESKEVWMPYIYQSETPGSTNGKWVRYYSTGAMVKGWYKTEGKTYYYDLTTGAMKKGRVSIDGKYYTFDSRTGVLK